MLKPYLKRAPTIIVIVVSGFAAWPTLFPDVASVPLKASARPPSTAQGAPSVVGPSDRDPFHVARSPGAKAILTVNSAAIPASPSTLARSASLPELLADEDKLLVGMVLGGTFIDGSEQIAIIDNKVYARGDQLRKADGSTLPYVVEEVHKGHAVLRRGRRNFVLGFSDVLRHAAKVEAPALAKSATLAKAEPVARKESAARKEPASRKKGASPTNRPGDNPGNPAAVLLQMLSGLGGSSAGGGSSGNGGGATSGSLSGLLGGGSGTSGISINQDTIQAGLDALMGKNDNIGREGTTP